MRANKSIVWLSGLVLSGILAAPAAAAPTVREIAGSKLLVQEYLLDTLDAPSGSVEPYQDSLLTTSFPDYLFFVALYPRAAAVDLPEPLKVANLFAVDSRGRVQLLSTTEEIAQFFRVGFNPTKKEVDAVRVAVLLLRARYSDYTIDLPQKDLKITLKGKERLGTAKLVVKEGGSGSVSVTVTLDSRGVPVNITERVALKPAVVAFAPPTKVEIAAAEKIVRSYLTEKELPLDPVQYIDDPRLVREFPGQKLFLGPVKGKDTKNRLNVLVVGPKGTPQGLFSNPGPLIPLLNAQGPVTTDGRRREMMDLFVKLDRMQHPGFTFKETVMEVTTDEGNTSLFSKTAAVGPGGRAWLLEVRINIGKRGRVYYWWASFRAV